MASRTLAAAGLVTALCGACFTDEGRGATGETTDTTTGGHDPTHVSPVGTATGGETSTGTTGTISGTTGDVTSTGATSETGSLCPAADDFPGLGADPACAACLATSCCDSVSACAGEAACTGAWSCVAAEACINAWAACPDYDASKPRIDAISGCLKQSCAAVCPASPCAAQEMTCDANPACGAVSACVVATCNDIVCPPEDPDCILACWGACAEMNPGGGEDWSALLYCLGLQCRGG